MPSSMGSSEPRNIPMSPGSPALQIDSLLLSYTGKPNKYRNTIFSKVFSKTKITNSFLNIDYSLGIRFTTEIIIHVIKRRKMNQTLHFIKDIQVYLKRSVV